MYLLDTNVVSKLRRPHKAAPRVRAWAGQAPRASFYLSVVTILEIEKGILLVERRDERQAESLRGWLDSELLTRFDGRILAIDLVIARRCAALHVPDRRPDRDALIAATALVHGMTLVTRNAADFEGTGVAVLNPWVGDGER
jgi:predicted nucleic acid-binding protein